MGIVLGRLLNIQETASWRNGYITASLVSLKYRDLRLNIELKQ